MSFTSLLEPMTEEALRNIGPFPTISLTKTGEHDIFVNECVPLPPFKNIYKERPPTPGDRRRIYDKSYHTVTNAIMILSHGFTFDPYTGRRKSNITFYNYTNMQKLKKQQFHRHEPTNFYKLGENSQNKHTNWERHTRPRFPQQQPAYREGSQDFLHHSNANQFKRENRQQHRNSTNRNSQSQKPEIKDREERRLTSHTVYDYFGCDVKTTKNILFSEKQTKSSGSSVGKRKLCETVSETQTSSVKRIKTDYQAVIPKK
ncbi:hypothetical protein ScPMuIL_012840 [Solemya velum]